MWKDSDKIIEIYNELNETELRFPCKCPDCKSESAHIYFHEHRGKRCGVWTWCSECCSFAHMSGFAPYWWSNPSFIDKNKLCAVPDYLEQNSKEIDNWINRLTFGKTENKQDAFVEDRYNVKFKIDIQEISSGTEGVLVVKNKIGATTVQFIYNDGNVVDVLIPKEELLEAVEVLEESKDQESDEEADVIKENEDGKLCCAVCGRELKTVISGHSLSLTCSEHGVLVVSTYCSEMDLDDTNYEIYLKSDNTVNTDSIKIISKIANLNYLESKKALESKTAVLIYKANDKRVRENSIPEEIICVARKLKEASLDFYITPDFGYEI